MKFTVLAVGKLKTAYLRDGVAEFVKRLTVYGGVTITELNESKLPSADDSKRQAIVAEEGERLLKQINPKSFVVLLDVKGKTMSSEALAEKIADLEGQYRNRYDEDGNLIGVDEGGEGGNRRGWQVVIVFAVIVLAVIAYFVLK